MFKFNKAKAGAINIYFGISSNFSIRLLLLNIPIGFIEFYIVKADICFGLYVKNMDKLNIYFNNFENVLIISIESL